MRDLLIGIGVTVIGGLISAGIMALLIMWRDLAVAKRDIDALAEIIGTERAKARKERKEVYATTCTKKSN